MIYRTNSKLLLERETNFMTKLEKKRYVFLGRKLSFFRFFL
ncbi:hypothetical protein LEP1GSC088_4749 [Leptospira interrogans str. L1207]|nr:hypothetical protein LEP1GSC088_4749 [Leptospira interrogans str. L1207]